MLDIGSSGGLTLSKFACLSKCKAAVGVELVVGRHILSCHFNRHLMMTTLCDMDIPVWYVNDDIKKFINFNGFSKVYMYDKAFPTDLMNAIAIIFNASSSVKMIASTKNLLEYGFQVKLITNLGSLIARGGEMSHTFYIYEATNYSTEWLLRNAVPEKKVCEYIEIASTKDRRFTENEQVIYSDENSEKALRPSKIQRALGGKDSKDFLVSDCLVENGASKLFNILADQKSITINGTLLTFMKHQLSKQRGSYGMFNVQSLSKVGKSEAVAAIDKLTKCAIMVPAYDENENGQILTGIIYDDKNSNNKYKAVVYNIQTKAFHEIQLATAMCLFDYEKSFPLHLDLQIIMKVYFYFLLLSLLLMLLQLELS